MAPWSRGRNGTTSTLYCTTTLGPILHCELCLYVLSITVKNVIELLHVLVLYVVIAVCSAIGFVVE